MEWLSWVFESMATDVLTVAGIPLIFLTILATYQDKKGDKKDGRKETDV